MSQIEDYKGKVHLTCLMDLFTQCPEDGLTNNWDIIQMPQGWVYLTQTGDSTPQWQRIILERESTFDPWMYLSHALRMALPMIRHWLTALGMNLPLSDSRLMSMLANQGERKEFLQMSRVIDQFLTHWIPSPRCHLGTVIGQVTPCPGNMLTIHLSLDKLL